MSFKRTFAIFIILLALGGVYYFYEMKKKPQEEEQKKLETAVFTVAEDKVTDLDMKRTKDNKPQDLVFVKKNDEWFMSSPVESKADQQSLIFLVKSIVGSKKEETVVDKAPDLKKFGLDNPQYRLIISDGKTKETLILGDLTVKGNSFYAKRENSDSVFLVSTGFRPNLDKKLIDYRNKVVVDTALDRLEKVSVTKGTTNFILEKKDDKWTVTAPKILRPGSKEIENIVSALIGIRAKNFKDDTPQNRKETGLDKPVIWAEFYEKGKKDPILIQLGTSEKEKKEVYALVEGIKEIYVLNSFDLKKFEKTPNDFIARDILNVEDKKIDHYTFKTAKTEYSLKKKIAKETGNTDWEFTLPRKKEANFNRVAQVLRTTVRFYVKDTVAIEGDVEKFGFKNPAAVITAKDKEGKELFEITFGAAAKDYKNPGFMYAKVKGEDYALLISEEAFKRLEKQLEDMSAPEEKKKEEKK